MINDSSTTKEKSLAWDLIGSKFWKLGEPRIKPTHQTIDKYLESIHPNDPCCIIGASTYGLINCALNKGLNITIVDFSKNMCNELMAHLKDKKINVVLHDILKKVPETLINKFSYVLTDRLINRFTADETKIFFRNSSQLLQSSGQLRTVIKIGLYELDLKLIDYQNTHPDEELIFDHLNNTINYSKARKALFQIKLKNGDIPSQTLLEWYVLRGKETRYTEASLEHLLKTEVNEKSWLSLLSRKLIDDNTSSILYQFTKNSF